MPLWLIEPVARPEDPIWQDREQYARVVARASTPALARIMAERLDRPGSDARTGFQYPGRASGFTNEKLYRVRSYDDGAMVSDGPAGVLEEVRRL